MRHTLAALVLSAALAAPSLAATPEEVVKTYADIALAGYEDSLTTVKTLIALQYRRRTDRHPFR